MELYISCSENKYDLYNDLNKYFRVELLEDTDSNTMGIGDIKIFIEPITKAIEALGNIIISAINTKKSSIIIKNGEKEFSFEGNLSNLENDEIVEILSKLLGV